MQTEGLDQSRTRRLRRGYGEAEDDAEKEGKPYLQPDGPGKNRSREDATGESSAARQLENNKKKTKGHRTGQEGGIQFRARISDLVKGRIKMEGPEIRA